MDDNIANTTVDISFLGSPKPPSQQPSQSTKPDPTLEELLVQSSTDIMRTFAASINEGAMKEANKNEEFRQELKRRLFRVIIKTYVWSTSRLTHETEVAEGRLAKDVQELLRAERDQDRLRVRLAELMAVVHRAVEAFAQF